MLEGAEVGEEVGDAGRARIIYWQVDQSRLLRAVARWQFMSILSKLTRRRSGWRETGGSLRNVGYSHPSAIRAIKIYPSTDISVIATTRVNVKS